MKRIIADSIAIFGDGQYAASVGLRKALKQRNRTEKTLVLDYTGRGAMLIGRDLRLDLATGQVRWYDIADRRKPVALFQFQRSSHLRDIILESLVFIRQVAGVQIKDATLVWAAEIAPELSSNGTVGLGA